MLRDVLQKKLGEMERDSPSPSLENSNYDISAKIGFLGRYLSTDIEQVFQRDSHYNLLDDRRRDYKLLVVNGGHTGQARHWLNKAFNEASQGYTMDSIQSSLRIAKKADGFSGEISQQIFRELDSLYGDYIEKESPKRALMWLNEAKQGMSKGLPAKRINTYLRLAKRQADEVGISLDLIS